MKEVKIVNYYNLSKNGKINDLKYVYLMCSCLNMEKGIQINRPQRTEYIKIFCPNCKRELGIIAKGIEDKKFELKLI